MVSSSLISSTLLALTCIDTAVGTKGVTRNTLILRRGADSGDLTSTLDEAVFTAQVGPDGEVLTEETSCEFAGIMALSHPMSLKSGDKFFSTGQLQLRSIEMMIDEINTSHRCGVTVSGKNYALSLTTYGDDSSKDKVGAIVKNGMVPALTDGMSPEGVVANYWVGPYSSGLTGIMSPFANETNTILVAGGAAATSVFAGYGTIFGTFPPTKKYLAQAIKALSEAGAKTVASLWEDASFTRGVCAALPSLAEAHGMALLSETEVPASPNGTVLDPIATDYSDPGEDPDVVVTCVYDAGCAEWISSLRRSGWSPRAQVFTVCVGMDSFEEAVGDDAMYMMGISPWDSSLAIEDGAVGWSAGDFADAFLSTTSRKPTYHSASAAASVGVLVQAIDRAESFDTDTIAEILATEEFTTLYGQLSFDQNGQSKAPSLLLQYDANLSVQTVYPLEAKSGDLKYPMPTWRNRDCVLISTCETGSEFTSSGTCRDDGTCDCSDPRAESTGAGPDAKCVIIPSENMTYVNRGLLIAGNILFAVQAILSLVSVGWTKYYAKRQVIRASQPIFLHIICFGTFVMSASILPMGIQGAYREDDAWRFDAACMAWPWLFSLGFAIVFSALFAKIWRVRKVLHAAQSFVRKKVEAKDVMSVMVAVISVQVVILACWQAIDPMTWHREVLTTDNNGYPTQSVGYCQSENSILPYVVPLVVFDFCILAYALYLCFISRKMSSEFQEGTWITASVLSIVQILILAIPILIIVENNASAFYFVRMGVVFLMSSTVQLLIFMPKMHRLHFPAPTNDARRSRGTFANLRNLGSVRRFHAAGRFSTNVSRTSSNILEQSDQGRMPALREEASEQSEKSSKDVEENTPDADEESTIESSSRRISYTDEKVREKYSASLEEAVPETADTPVDEVAF